MTYVSRRSVRSRTMLTRCRAGRCAFLVHAFRSPCSHFFAQTVPPEHVPLVASLAHFAAAGQPNLSSEELVNRLESGLRGWDAGLGSHEERITMLYGELAEYRQASDKKFVDVSEVTEACAEQASIPFSSAAPPTDRSSFSQLSSSGIANRRIPSTRPDTRQVPDSSRDWLPRRLPPRRSRQRLQRSNRLASDESRSLSDTPVCGRHGRSNIAVKGRSRARFGESYGGKRRQRAPAERGVVGIAASWRRRRRDRSRGQLACAGELVHPAFVRGPQSSALPRASHGSALLPAALPVFCSTAGSHARSCCSRWLVHFRFAKGSSGRRSTRLSGFRCLLS